MWKPTLNNTDIDEYIDTQLGDKTPQPDPVATQPYSDDYITELEWLGEMGKNYDRTV